jgi:outer membrane protein assembly factor BamB
MASSFDRFVLLVTALVTFAAPSSAQNWPRFRGPSGSGIAESEPLPTTWDAATGKGVLWKAPIPGVGHSSPVVWGDRVLISTAVSTTPLGNYNPKAGGIDPSTDVAVHEWRVIALDKKTGRQLWSQTAHRGVPKVKRHVKATQANATPATDGRFVVVSFGSEGLYTYDMHGKLLWKQDVGILDPGYWGQPDLQWGFASSPIIYRDLVILQCDIQKDSFMVAFNLKDGSQAWRIKRDEIPAWSTPVIYEGKTRTELITSGSLYYRGNDPATGKELWRLRDDTQVKVPSPVIANDLFFLSGGNPRGRDFYAVRPTASGDISLAADQERGPHVAWRKTRGSSYTPTPLVYDGLLYVPNDNGVLTVYDAVSGAQLYSNRIGTTNSTFSASPVAGRGHVYFPSEDGEVFVVKAGPKYELVAANRMGEALMATPAISDGILIVRGQQHVYAVR